MEERSTSNSMASHDGLIDTSQRGVRVRLGLFLAMSYLTAEFFVIALHEGAHAITYKICRTPIYGIYLSPFAGQVLGLEWGPPGATRTLQHLAGIIATQVFGMALGIYVWRRQVRQDFFMRESILFMLTAAVFTDSVYAVLSVPGGFGDFYEAAQAMTVSVFWLLPAAAALVAVTQAIVRRAMAKWRRTFCPQIRRKEYEEVFLVWFGSLAVAAALYWLPALLMMERAGQ